MRGLLAVALIGAAFSLGGAQHPKDDARAEQNRAAQIQQSAAQIADAVREIRPEKDEGCQNREDKRSSDLCAQWKAADAARSAAEATWLAAILSFFGTVLVALTFAETRKTARRELRAYIHVSEVSLVQFEANKEIHAKITFINAGKTPASKVGSNWRIFAYPPPYPKDVETIAPHGSSGVVGAGDIGHMMATTDPINQEGIDLVRKGKNHVVVFGEIRYTDAFNRQRYTKYRYQLVFIRGEGVFQVCDTGNEAN